jgi:hypothetical protein
VVIMIPGGGDLEDMSQDFTARERRALEALSQDEGTCHRLGQLPRGVGLATMETLLRRGLVERGPSPRCVGPDRWCVTDTGRQLLDGEPDGGNGVALPKPTRASSRFAR